MQTAPVLGPAVPKSGGRLTEPLGRLLLRLFGWRLAGASPEAAQCVLIVAPHTSNWDFLFGLAAKWALRLRVRFVGKHTLFRFPLGVFMRGVGGIPVNRNATGGFVEKVAAEFAVGDPLYLVIAPEGTRKPVAQWKTGFHRIAVAAGVPILPVALDYSAREVRLFPMYTPCGDYARDLEALRALYTPAMACRSENYAVPTA
jgi:1-acyl-sn-glycerol-3-phosphate acyltransferase